MTRQQAQRLLIAGIAALFLSTTCFIAAQRGADPETRFRDALRKQQVEGDLNAAIVIYRDIVASNASTASLKARALLQLAVSLETLGQQAETVYQRIVKEFADQPAASQARTKLAAMKPTVSAGVTETQIRFGAGVQNVVATDGQRAIYWNSDLTTLFIGDVLGKTRKEIFKARASRRPRAEASRDLSMVFLYFIPAEESPATFYAVIRTDGSGTYREINLTEKGYNADLTLFGVSWSFDNRYVVLCQTQKDRVVRPMRLSIEDGQLVDLIPGHPRNVLYAVLSPDGSTLAWQEGLGSRPAVYIKPVQGGGEIQTIEAEAAQVADWSLDRRHLIFGAREKEVFSLYTIPVENGRLAGSRTFVRGIGNTGNVTNMSRPFTVGNALVYSEVLSPDDFRVYRASLDASGKLSEWAVLKTRMGRNAAGYPVSSPDGTRIAYRTGRRGQASSVRVLNVATGEDQEILPSDDPIMNCIWGEQPTRIYCGRLKPGTTEILAIDTVTKRAETLTSLPGFRILQAVSPDGRILQMYNRTGVPTFPRWEIGSEQDMPDPRNDFLSPDGRWAWRPGTGADQRRNYQLRPASAGDEAWEHVVYPRKQAPDFRGQVPLRFSPDSKWLVYHDLDSEGKDALFRVSTGGGEPQRLGDYPTTQLNSHLNVSFDGRHFLVETSPTTPVVQEAEFWLLQNFLPAAPAPTTRR